MMIAENSRAYVLFHFVSTDVVQANERKKEKNF